MSPADRFLLFVQWGLLVMLAAVMLWLWRQKPRIRHDDEHGECLLCAEQARDEPQDDRQEDDDA